MLGPSFRRYPVCDLPATSLGKSERYRVSSEESHVVLEMRGPVAIVRLNRPEKLNAFTFRMITDIRRTVERAAADENAVAIVTTDRIVPGERPFDEICAYIEDSPRMPIRMAQRDLDYRSSGTTYLSPKQL